MSRREERLLVTSCGLHRGRAAAQRDPTLSSDPHRDRAIFAEQIKLKTLCHLLRTEPRVCG